MGTIRPRNQEPEDVRAYDEQQSEKETHDGFPFPRNRAGRCEDYAAPTLIEFGVEPSEIRY